MSAECRELERSVRDLVEGSLPGSLRASLLTHAGDCPPCRHLLARERRLLTLLQTNSPAPQIDLPAPPLPQLARVLSPAWKLGAGVAAAAALLAMAYVGGGMPLGGGGSVATGNVATGTAATLGGPVRVLRVVDAPGHLPQPDEGLLALTAGVEAVAMRRPTALRRASPSGERRPQ